MTTTKGMRKSCGLKGECLSDKAFSLFLESIEDDSG